MPSNEEHTPLKPCPFCGGEAQVEHSASFMNAYKREEFSVCCVSRCVAGKTWVFMDRDEAIAAWSRRAGEAALVEALENLLGTYLHATTAEPKEGFVIANRDVVADAREALAATKGEG